MSSVHRVPCMQPVSSESEDSSDDNTQVAVASLDYDQQQFMPSEIHQCQVNAQDEKSIVSDESIQEFPSSVNTRSRQRRTRHETKSEKQRRHRKLEIAAHLNDTLLTPQKDNIGACFPDEEPDPHPMLSDMLRNLDLAGVWDDEQVSDQRDPVDIEQVVVAVEATAICRLDLTLRTTSGLSEDDISAEANEVSGSNFVGVVIRCCKQAEKRYGILPGDRVASILRWGGNARYVTVPPQQLIRVSKTLDSADVAALLSFYLPAFELLNFGRGRRFRYSSNSLDGKKVFITTYGASLEAQALISLARLQGSREIFVTAPREHHELLRKLGVATLEENPLEWLSFVTNTMDVVIDLNFPKNFHCVKQIVKPGGFLICSPRPKRKEDNRRWNCTPSVSLELGYLFERYQLSMMNHASLFDFTEYATQFRQEVFEDMTFLLEMLATRKIRPKIERFITLKDVSDTHKELVENKAVKGAIICEPWKE